MGNSSDDRTPAHSRIESSRDNVVDFRTWAQTRSQLRHPSSWVDPGPPTALTDRSPDALWRADFEVHAGQHDEATTSGMWVLAPVVEATLRQSLPVFQLGKTGAGFHLLNQARGVVSDDLLCALRLFVVEEQEHARLSALICSSLDITMLDEHWSDGLFRRVRRIRGFRLEMLMMLIAEFITAEIYETLTDGVGDPALSRLFARMHADELRHLEFLMSVLPSHLGRLPSPIGTATARAWKPIAYSAVAIVAIEHRALLRACGSNPRKFFRSTRSAMHAGAERIFS